MPNPVLIDNDVVFKACCYASAADVLNCLAPIGPAHILGTLQFVLPKRVNRLSTITNKTVAAQALQALLAMVAVVEPEDAEIALASSLEAEAVKRQIDLDSGESQLLAILVTRALPLLVTGDKRAIAAMEIIAAVIADRSKIDGKIACLEQLMLHCLASCNPQTLRSRICAEPLIDRAISNCFSCTAEAIRLDSVLQGLSSYINSVRTTAANVLVRSYDLSAVTP